MRIAVLGAGNVGATLGRRFAERHDVVYGVRDPSGERARDAARAAGADLAPIPEAVASADAVVLAVPGGAVASVVEGAGLGSKPVIDATNVLAGDIPGGHPSVAHLVATTGAPVAKAFNTIGWEVMADPSFGTDRAVLPVAGDDEARAVAIDLATGLGFEVIDLGGIDAAPLVEAFAAVWIRRMLGGAGREWAFGILER